MNKMSLLINVLNLKKSIVEELYEEIKELKESYLLSPTEDTIKSLDEKIIKMIKSGYVTPNKRLVYDFSIEKYKVIDTSVMDIKVFDKDISVKRYIKMVLGREPKGIIHIIPSAEVLFSPNRKELEEIDGVMYANTFMRSKILSYEPIEDEMINKIDWNRYPRVKALFSNVFVKKERIDYFINWLAYCLQTLEKSRTAIISKGVQGTGKGVIFNQLIRYAFGEPYTLEMSNEAISSQYNMEIENKLFIVANEIKGDFRDGNKLYEKLKIFITEDMLGVEDKNIKRKMIKNYMNLWFHTNNAVPLQIQPSDRRYTVFNTSDKKLIDVAKELGYQHEKFFIADMNKHERDDFLFDLMRLKYDYNLATRPMNTEEKQLICEASTPQPEIIINKLKEKDFDYFRNILDDFFDDGNEDMLNLQGDIFKKFNITTTQDFIEELGDGLFKGYIKSPMLQSLVRIIINPKLSSVSVGKMMSKYLGKSKQKKINGKKYNVFIVGDEGS